MDNKKVYVNCEIEITLDMIGGKCKPLILHILIEQGVKRFSELKKQINIISQKTLTNQLKELEYDGLVNRKVYAQVPPKVEYSISEKGKTLKPILDLMCEWGFQNKSENYIVLSPQCESEK